MFKWKYPLWYAKDIAAKDCTWFEMARAGVWYTDRIRVEDSAIEAPKNFRRCHDVTLKNVSFANAAETLWNCDGVTMEQVTAKGDYLAMNSQNMVIRGLTLYGNYSFDGAKNVEIHNSRLLSKHAFWNSENVTVYDFYIRRVSGLERKESDPCELYHRELAGNVPYRQPDYEELPPVEYDAGV